MAANSAPLLLLLLLLLLLQPLTLISHLVASATAATSGEKKTYIFRVDYSLKPSIFPTHEHWYASPSLVDGSSGALVHTYSTVFHGFSASLSADRAGELSRHPAILAVFEDRLRRLHTTRSPQFLGLRNQKGLWSLSDYGADVIVGVLDTGVWPERRSFSDHNIGPVPPRWRGACETGPSFPASVCNRKLVGARIFSRGHDAAAAAAGGIGGINETVEFRSARDADGHGTHTASTAAGRHVFGANMAGYAKGIAKGVAPKARVAVYKVCWKGSGCLDSDILAGFDRAVADGVDVISVSIGGGDGVSSPYYLDPIAVGSFGAVSRGVFVATSAGNDGPAAMSITNLAPWLTTVGAGTIDRTFPADIVLGNGQRLDGVSLYSGRPLAGEMYPLVYPGKFGGLPASLCMENSLDPKLVRGKIVVCDRGSSPRVAKGLVVLDAGGVGMILANGISNGEGLVGDAHVLPACAVGSGEGDALKSYIATASNPSATIAFKGTVVGVKPAPVVASFSARGPNGLTPEILKPDLIAPGVNILAAWTDAVGPTGLDSDHRKTEFNILSGTSMACPHVSGAAALLKSAHPSWSPAAIRSAMMTTANVVDNTFQQLTDEGTGQPATPLDFGAGNLNLYKAMDPGLIYDLSDSDYISFLCSLGYWPRTIQVITHSPVTCPAKRPAPENINYPSISVVFEGAPVVNQSKTVVRTATNVGAAAAVYRAKVEMSGFKGLAVMVKPRKLVFSPATRAQSFAVTITMSAAAAASAAGEEGNSEAGVEYGYLTWSDGTHEVRSPIVVSRILPL